MLTADEDQILDDLLSRWHHWAAQAKGVKAWAPKALVCGEFRISRQYDDVNGALDDDIEDERMRAVDFQVTEMADPWRSAIYALARNLCTGLAVWSSPRLPVDPACRAAVVTEARVRLAQRLVVAGVM